MKLPPFSSFTLVDLSMFIFILVGFLVKKTCDSKTLGVITYFESFDYFQTFTHSVYFVIFILGVARLQLQIHCNLYI